MLFGEVSDMREEQLLWLRPGRRGSWLAPSSCATIAAKSGSMSKGRMMPEHMGVAKKIVAIFNAADLSEVDSLFSVEFVDREWPSWVDAPGAKEFKQIVPGARKSFPQPPGDD